MILSVRIFAGLLLVWIFVVGHSSFPWVRSVALDVTSVVMFLRFGSATDHRSNIERKYSDELIF